VLGIGQGNKGSYGFGADGCRGEVAVQQFSVAVLGNGQRPD
jgi:hypothetical protein